MVDISSARRGTGSEPIVQQHEWSPRHLIWLAVATAAMFCVVFWAALGRPPLSGTKIIAVLGFTFVVLVNLSIGALASGAVIEHKYPHWSRFGKVDHFFLYAALAGLLLTDAGAAWWLFSSDSGGLVRWIFLLIALGGMAGGAWWAWPALPHAIRRADGARKTAWALWPQHEQHARATGTWRFFALLTVLLGAALGVVVAVAYLGISAWAESQDVPAGHPMPATIAGIHGGYVALGDSYSAGEGLPPFAPGTSLTACDRSESSAYPDLLIKLLRAQDHQAPFSYTACSGALLRQILNPTNRSGGVVPPQISGKTQPSVGLVTLTIGGNNALFSKVVVTCLTDGNCLHRAFPPPGISEQTARHVAPGDLLNRWGPATIVEIGNEEGVLFRTLRHDFPHARIVVIGYPYLFPAQPGPGFPFMPPMCASILNRLSATERAGIRTLQDEFNDRSYEEAAISGIEFVSPAAIWTGHEPCGASGQYTNSVKPYLNFPNPVNGGSFHPNAAGQQTLAALTACYLNANRQPPEPFGPGGPPIRQIPDRLVTPRQLHMAPAPGLTTVPGSGEFPLCHR
jgi:GDSL-like lipase/acylhydrolase family protein